MKPDFTPDWNDAPSWANWLAMDAGGEWYWYENKPELSGAGFFDPVGKVELAEIPNWTESLQQRPKP